MNDMATTRDPASLTRGLVDILNRPIAAADRKRAALHLLDWIGCAVAGATTPPGVAMIAYGKTMPSGGCRTVGGVSLSARDAALINGSFGNVLEMDDLYRTALVHPARWSFRRRSPLRRKPGHPLQRCSMQWSEGSKQ